MIARNARAALCAIFALSTLSQADDVHADQRSIRAGGSLNMDVAYDQAPDLREETFGLSLRVGVGNKAPILYMVGLDYRLGVSQPLGFAYDLNLQPIGVGLLLGEIGRFSVHAGVGMSGITKQIARAGQWSAEARLDLRVGDRVRVEMVARIRETFARKSRENGSENAPFGDEMTAGIRLRLGRTFTEFIRSSNGYYLGVYYSERDRRASVGIRFGYSLDFSK